MASTRRRALALALIPFALLLAACGGDDGTDGDEGATGDDSAETTTTADASSKDVVVTASDFEFDGVPAKAAAGTKFSLENTSTKELHEFVAIKLPDGEKRPAADLVKLPPAEQEKLASGPPATVILRAPGGEQIDAVGDGTIAAPGRYLVICSIPTGADPGAYLAAAQASQDGPPDVPGGPPHLVQGMYAELTIE